MARQPRLAIGGLIHYVLLRGHNGTRVMIDAVDRQLFVGALREGAAGVVVHGHAVLDNEVHLLLRPPDAASLSRAVQAIGRRFVAAYNRRHGRSGTPWDGRFRAAVVEPGEWSLMALRRVDRLATANEGEPSLPARWRNPAERSLLVDPPELWALGNTPFERERAYADLLARPLPATLDETIARALSSGRVIGGESFLQALSRQTGRRLVAGPRGRPRATRPV